MEVFVVKFDHKAPSTRSTDGLKSRKVDCWIRTGPPPFFFLPSLTEETGKWLSWERVSSVSRWSRMSTEPLVGGQGPLLPCGSTPMGGSLTTVPSLPGVSLSHLALFLVTLTLKLLLPLSCPPSSMWRGRPDPAYYLAGGVCGPDHPFVRAGGGLGDDLVQYSHLYRRTWGTVIYPNDSALSVTNYVTSNTS